MMASGVVSCGMGGGGAAIGWVPGDPAMIPRDWYDAAPWARTGICAAPSRSAGPSEVMATRDMSGLLPEQARDRCLGQGVDPVGRRGGALGVGHQVSDDDADHDEASEPDDCRWPGHTTCTPLPLLDALEPGAVADFPAVAP